MRPNRGQHRDFWSSDRPPRLAHRLQLSWLMRNLALGTLLALLAACDGTGRPIGTTGNGQGKVDGESSCPIADYDADKISAAIDGAGSCFVAAGIAESCAYGSSLDVSFVASATAICESGFGSMIEADKSAYETLLGKCAKKYENTEGTLYRSMNAYCDLEVTKLFTALYPESEYGSDLVSYNPDCPVEADPDKTVRAISSASSCGSAADIAIACAWGSSIDTQFVAAASELCSGETGELTTADAALHDTLVESCNALYTEGSGTLQLSFSAHCRMQVDVVFNTLAGDVE
jgi:hypothetical protein